MAGSSPSSRSSTGCGSSSSSRSRGSPLAIENLGGVRREGLHEGRVENRTGTTAHAVDGQFGAAEIDQNHSVRGEVSDPCSGRDGVLTELLRRAITVPPLRDLVQGALHAGADANPACDPAPDLAARPVVAGSERWTVTHQALGDPSATAGESPRVASGIRVVS